MTVVEAGRTLLWGLLGAAACAALAPLAPDLAGEGLLLHVAERLASGERLYLDVEATGGPLLFETLGLLFDRIGAEVAVARAVLVALTGLGAACAFRLARAAQAGSFAHAAAACVVAAPALTFPEGFRLTAPWAGVHLGLATVLAAVLGLRSLLWGAAAGLLAAGVLLTLPGPGLVLIAGLVVLFARLTPRGQRSSRIGVFLAGSLLGAGGLLARYAGGDQLEGLASSFGSAWGSLALPAWRQALSATHLERTLPGLVAAFGAQDAASGERLALARLLLCLPALTLIATLARRLFHGPLPPALWGVTALVVAWALEPGRLPTWSELAPALVPSVLLALLLVSAGGVGREGSIRRATASGLTALLLGVACAVSVGLHRAAGPTVLAARVPLRPVGAARTVEAVEVVRAVRARVGAGEPMLVLGDAPLLYFATATRNPTRFPSAIPALTADDELALVSGLGAVDTVVSVERDPSTVELSRLQRHLERHFRVAGAFRGRRLPTFLVLERGPDRGPVHLDLVELSGQAHRFIRDQQGALRPARRRPPALPVTLNRRPLPFVLGVGGGGVDFELELPARARFQAEIGLAPLQGTRLHRQPRGTLSVSLERGGTFERLGSFELAEASHDWTPVEVDLGRFAGDRATLRLAFEPARDAPPSSLAWWGSPRIVSHRVELR